MDTATALARVNAFARAVKPDVPAVDVALAAVRTLLARVDLDYVLVGGLAVVHHGYVRATRDIDLLVDRAELARVEGQLASSGIERTAPSRLLHRATDVNVDLLFAGDPIPPGSVLVFRLRRPYLEASASPTSSIFLD